MISIVMVNFNTKEKTWQSIESIVNSCAQNKFEIILVDNSSQDGSHEFFKEKEKQNSWLRYIYNSENYGYGKANNIGVNAAHGEFLILVNPDIIVQQNNFADFFINKLKSNKVVVVAPRILYPNGQIQPNQGGDSSEITYILQSLKIGSIIRSFGLAKVFVNILKYCPFADKTFIGKYLKNYDQIKLGEQKCDWVSGACLGVRKVDFDKVHGFDEKFFLYCEDEDLCRRLRVFGEIIWDPDLTVIHDQGFSLKNSKNILTKGMQERYLSNLYFVSKYRPFFSYYFLKLYYFFFFILNSVVEYKYLPFAWKILFMSRKSR